MQLNIVIFEVNPNANKTELSANVGKIGNATIRLKNSRIKDHHLSRRPDEVQNRWIEIIEANRRYINREEVSDELLDGEEDDDKHEID